MTKAIEISHLSKYYQSFKAVDDISLSIQEGEMFGFIGPNGAGKSTTIKMLLNFVFPTSGSAKIFGKDCIKDAMEIKKEIGYISSDVRYYNGMTSKDIFKYSALFHDVQNYDEKIKDYVEYFDIDLNKPISKLSLGNKKKVAIVSALIHDPRLLILDEPTNGLDPRMQHRLFDLLKKRQNEGMTIFLSSHDLHEVQSHCDRAAFIKKGKIISVESLDKELFEGKKIMIKSTQILESELMKWGAKRIKMIEPSKWSFIYEHDIAGLLKHLSHYSLDDIEIRSIDLEDKFLELYE